MWIFFLWDKVSNDVVDIITEFSKFDAKKCEACNVDFYIFKLNENGTFATPHTFKYDTLCETCSESLRINLQKVLQIMKSRIHPPIWQSKFVFLSLTSQVTKHGWLKLFWKKFWECLDPCNFFIGSILFALWPGNLYFFKNYIFRIKVLQTGNFWKNNDFLPNDLKNSWKAKMLWVTVSGH